MWTEAVTGSAVIGGLHGVLEALQVLGPELGQEVPHRIEPVRAQQVQALLAARADRDQARVLEHLQVLRYRLLGDVEVVRDLVDRPRLVADQPQDRPAAWLGEGGEGCVAHEASLTRSKRFDLYK